MFEQLLGLGSLLRVPLQHRLDQTPQQFALALENGQTVIHIALENQFLDFRLVESLCAGHVSLDRIEGRLPSQKNIENDSRRPNVHFVIVVLENHFRGQVVDAAPLGAERTGFLNDFGKPQIDDFDLIGVLFGFQENIFRLQVTMHLG